MPPKRATPLRNDRVQGSGLYAITPFERLDTHGKTIVKIGISKDLDKREGNYHTYFIKGYYPLNYLYEPFDHETKLTTIERYIWKDMIEQGAVRMPRHWIDGHVSQTEWFYANHTQINDAFKDAMQKFGGHHQDYSMNNKEYDRNANRLEKELGSHKFIGEIIYPIPQSQKKAVKKRG